MSSPPSPTVLVSDFLDEVGVGEISRRSPPTSLSVTPSTTTRAIPGRAKSLLVRQFQERVRISRRAFPDTVDEMCTGVDTVMVAWRSRGTHLGDLPGFPASREQITLSGMTVYYLADSKLTGHWEVTDRLGVYHQLRQHSQDGKGL